MDARYEFTDEQLRDWGYVAWRQVDGLWLGVLPMTFGKGRLCADLNLTGFEDAWCYESLGQAVEAMLRWDPAVSDEPAGWFRHPYSGRRRPSGDVSKEHVAA
jgi:hypothetical protein